MTNTTATPSINVDRAMAFVKGLHDHCASYHNHKESMAYTGLAIFTGAGGAALVSNDWPPKAWGADAHILALLAITALWLGVLAYLRFQLRQRLLAKWIVSPPSDADLAPKDREPIDSVLFVKCADWAWLLKAAVWVMKAFVKCVDWFWPLKESVLVMEAEDSPPVYPSALVDAWVDQEERGTDALIHERFIVCVGWVLYVVVVLFTVRAWAA